ncbi:MAG: TRAP transporter fused permease subunit [Acidobacteriota bacterium]
MPLGASLLVAFVLLEVNYPFLRPQTQLALFAFFGLTFSFLSGPPRAGARRAVDLGWVALAAATCGWVAVQSEPIFRSLWLGGSSLGDRAGAERGVDIVVGVLGLLVVLEATRRTVGWALPILSGTFVLYAFAGPNMPSWLFPHRGYSLERVVAQAFLHSQGVFGTALKVMFAYVFLFVLFGALLEATGATAFVINAAQRIFKTSRGGAAKVSVLSSGLMGSLSGSAVANTATTGTFTIPLMRSSGFKPSVAAGVEAAASSGGALVPPVMGAGAYMMLEIVDPPVTYFEIVRAAIVPAVLYYLSLFFIVDLQSRKLAKGAEETPAGEMEAPAGEESSKGNSALSGLIFFAALGLLIVLILMRFSPFRAVSVAAAGIVALSLFDARVRLGPKRLVAACVKAARGSASLVAAASCVGIVIGVVTLTGVGTRLPSVILPLAQENLFLALVLIMVSSIVLGMGLPSAVCYLLMATLIGPVLGDLGVVPLAAHLFIFYFGMMSMVTPPVALAAYTAASIAGTKIMETGLTAFRFALVGFTLPYMFVFRPELLLLAADGGPAEPVRVVSAILVAVLGIGALAGGIAGYWLGELGGAFRAGLLLCAAALLVPATGETLFSVAQMAGTVVLAALTAARALRR